MLTHTILHLHRESRKCTPINKIVIVIRLMAEAFSL